MNKQSRISNNQKGIGYLVLILIVCITGIVGFVGWYVWDANHAAPITTFEQCVASGNPIMESYPEVCTTDGKSFKNPKQVVEINNFKGWQTYSGLGLTFKYPEGWKQDSNNGNDPNVWAFFISPDYKPATELGPSVLSGYWLELFVFKTSSNGTYNSFNEYLNALKSTEQGCGGDYRISKIDDLPAILSDIKCHGSYISATSYKNGNEYNFRFSALDEDKPEVKELFDKILSTVVFD